MEEVFACCGNQGLLGTHAFFRFYWPHQLPQLACIIIAQISSFPGIEALALDMLVFSNERPQSHAARVSLLSPHLRKLARLHRRLTKQSSCNVELLPRLAYVIYAPRLVDMLTNKSRNGMYSSASWGAAAFAAQERLTVDRINSREWTKFISQGKQLAISFAGAASQALSARRRMKTCSSSPPASESEKGAAQATSEPTTTTLHINRAITQAILIVSQQLCTINETCGHSHNGNAYSR
jgi:hypothetical protein